MFSRHATFWRYTAFQVPGWILAAIGGWWIHRGFGIPVCLAFGILVVWVVKDYALYPFLRFAYETDRRPQIERLIGARGRAVGPLTPDGYVRVRGELWRAKHEVTDTIEGGEAVEVTGVDRMLVIVRMVRRRNSPPQPY